jgi:hypothetical protein
MVCMLCSILFLFLYCIYMLTFQWNLNHSWTGGMWLHELFSNTALYNYVSGSVSL